MQYLRNFIPSISFVYFYPTIQNLKLLERIPKISFSDNFSCVSTNSNKDNFIEIIQSVKFKLAFKKNFFRLSKYSIFTKILLFV